MLLLILAIILVSRRKRRIENIDSLNDTKIEIKPTPVDPYKQGPMGGVYRNTDSFGDEKTIPMGFDSDKTIPLDLLSSTRRTLHFTVTSGQSSDERRIQISNTAIIGRSATCAMPLNDSRASSEHAELKLRPDGQLSIRDLRSTNGTLVNGKRIEQETILRAGSQITIGETSLTLK